MVDGGWWMVDGGGGGGGGGIGGLEFIIHLKKVVNPTSFASICALHPRCHYYLLSAPCPHLYHLLLK